MYQLIKSPLKSLLRRFNLDVVRYNHNPHNTLLGLRNRPIRTILDIGANIGQSAKHYRQVFEDATIYCFEPLPDVYRTLEEWAKTQEGKVKTFNVALGDESGYVTMNLHVDHSPSSSLLNTTTTSARLYPQTQKQATVTVVLERLDNFVSSLELCEEILVKMDVQGYETRVIQGGRRVLDQAAGCILEACLQPLYEEQPSFAELVSVMYDLGFAYAGNLNQSYDESGYSIFIDAVFLKHNYLTKGAG